MTTIPAKDFFGGGQVTVVGNEASNDYKKSALQPPEEQQAKPSFTDSLLGSITDAAKGGLNQIKQGVNTISSGAPGQNPIIAGTEAALKVGSGAASIIQSPLAPLFAPVGAAIDAVGNAVGSIPAVQKFANSKAGEVTSRVAEDVANAGNVAGTIAGVKGITKIPETIKSGVDAFSKAKDTLVGNPSDTAAADIVNSYYKAVKPSVAGKTATGQFDKYNADVINSVDTIRQNKTKLSFEDENGTTRVGETPKTRGEFADAIGQTKKLIFDQYNELEKKTNGTGVTIQLDKAGTALDDVIKSEALKLTNPEAVKYAQEMQTRLQNPDGSYKQITPDVAQTAISNWNSSLKAFYRNPTYENASRAAIDAGVVHQIRVALDDAIHNATGENYQAIKNQYGALSAIEKDVNKSAIAQAKATGSNVSGLGKYVDVFAGGDMLGGILSLNPALFAKGVAQTGINHFFQYLNSPDRAIEKMFKHAENYTNQPLRTPSISQPTKTTTPSTTNIPDSIPPESKTSQFINTVKTKGQRGFVKNPLATTEKIHPDDLATMSDFTDYAAGSYKPSAAEAQKLELDASRLWEHYFPNKTMPKSTQAMANEFGRVLEKNNFGKDVQPRDESGRFAPKGKAGEPQDALLAEARKYKTPEEFVKAQGEPILHGTNKSFDTFDVSKRGANEKDFQSKNAFFFTDSLDTAKSYGKNIQERYGKFTNPLTIDADGAMYSGGSSAVDMKEVLRDAIEKAKNSGNDVVIVKNLSDRKDWGNYEPATHYAVLDTNKLLTKSQLTDLWKKANSAPTSGL